MPIPVELKEPVVKRAYLIKLTVQEPVVMEPIISPHVQLRKHVCQNTQHSPLGFKNARVIHKLRYSEVAVENFSSYSCMTMQYKWVE